MSVDDYASDYFAPEEGSQQSSYEGDSQQPVQAPQPAPPATVSLEQFNQLQQQLAALQANPLQSIGYQPVQQNTPQWTPEQEKLSKQFLEAQGVVTREDLRQERISMAAEAAGYVNREHLEATFNSVYFEAHKGNNTQQIAELQRIANVYDSNPAAAIKAFEKFKSSQSQAPTQSQSFGHVPSQNPAQSQSAPRFSNAQEFNSFRQSNPAEGERMMKDWIEKKIAPFQI
jgi:hypothetical protein